MVILELKKGRTPRDVVAQILEYAAWASRLSYEDLNVLAMKYYDRDVQYQGMELREIHQLVFYPDDEMIKFTKFNENLRLYIVAEEITKTVRDVVRYLSVSGNIDINCMKYEVFKASNGEFYISTEMDKSNISISKSTSLRTNSTGWNGEIPVKQIVKNAVDMVLQSRTDGIFTAKEVISQVITQYSDCNKSTIRCQLYTDCVNHSSRKHYKGGQLDLYYFVGNGRFRLYNRNKDGEWNADGEKI